MWQEAVEVVRRATEPHNGEDMVLSLFWKEWVETWESYVYEMREYRDFGDWVLTLNEARARGREGIPVEAPVFQIWNVRDGKIVIVRLFGSEAEAFKAVEMEE